SVAMASSPVLSGTDYRGAGPSRRVGSHGAPSRHEGAKRGRTPLPVEDSLPGIPLCAVREEGHDRLSRPEPLRDLQRGAGGGAGRAAREESLLAREDAARLERVGVADSHDLVDHAAVQDRPDLRQADSLDLVGAGRAAAEDRTVWLDSDA